MLELLAFDSGDLVKVIAVAGGILIALLAILMGSLKSISTSRARERTKREIAAYIAEGSITAAEGERLIAAVDSGSEEDGEDESAA